MHGMSPSDLSRSPIFALHAEKDLVFSPKLSKAPQLQEVPDTAD